MPFFKKVFASNLRPFLNPRCVYEIYNRKIEANQLSNPAKMNPASTVTELLAIILKIKPSKQACFTNIKLLGSMFCLTHVKVLACVIRIILAIMFFFQNCVCLDYFWVENVQDGARSCKDKEREGCCWGMETR